jgi:hypothetical protein
MKRILLSVAIAAVLAGGVSFVAARWMGVRPQPIHETGWLSGQLGLSAEQTEAVRQLESEFRETLNRDCAAHCEARYELGKSLTDPAAAGACVDRMCAAQSSAERATMGHILKVRGLLRPDQQKKYDALIQRQLSTACPMGVHSR